MIRIIIIIIKRIYNYFFKRIQQKKKKYELHIGNYQERKQLTEILFSTEMELLLSSKRIKGIGEMYIKEKVIVFKPIEYTIFMKDELLFIPFSENIQLFQTFAPIKWDNRNVLVIPLSNQLPRFSSKNIFLRFKKAYEVEIWYMFCHSSTVIQFPKDSFLQKDISQLLSFISCLLLTQLNSFINKWNSFIPFLKLKELQVQSIPLTQSIIHTSFDGSMELTITFSSNNLNIFSKSFISIKGSFFCIPFTLRLCWHINSFFLRLNQKESTILWIEIIPYQFCCFLLSIGKYFLLPISSCFLTFLSFLLNSFLIGKQISINVKDFF